MYYFNMTNSRCIINYIYNQYTLIHNFTIQVNWATSFVLFFKPSSLRKIYIYIYIGFKMFFYVVRHLHSSASYLPTGLDLGFFRSWSSLYLPSRFSSVFLVLSFVLASTSVLFWVHMSVIWNNNEIRAAFWGGGFFWKSNSIEQTPSWESESFSAS